MAHRTTYGPCPALGRGLAVLETLADGQPLRLEALARHLGLPKSSVLRILQTLCERGVLTREPSGLYRALQRLVPVRASSWTEQRRLVLQVLSQTTGQTAEWWELQDHQMLLVAQEYAAGEIRVQAQIGFLRSFRHELEAVAVAGAALYRQKPGPRCWHNGPAQQQVSLTAAAARSLVASAASTGVAADPHCNTNGVRRFARLVHRPHPGVLAVAAFVPYGGRLDEPAIAAALATAATGLIAPSQGD